VCLVNVQGDGRFEMTQTKYRLTEEQKQADGSLLFDFCAECLKAFIDQYTSEADGSIIRPGQELPLGFTVRSRVQKRVGARLTRQCSSRTRARRPCVRPHGPS
jgi:hypothetical protein